jgi:DNA-directed RNA polymerase subunit RPC12/RpoP
MKMDITIPDHLPDLNEEDLKAAAKRREKYSLVRDLQAKEFNEAIASRLTKDREKQECSQGEDRKQVKCEKCGKEFLVGITTKGIMNCPECKQIIEIG